LRTIIIRTTEGSLTKEPITWSAETQQADWIVHNLRGDYTVAMLLPPAFQAYARLLHPIVRDTETGRLVTRWKDVAANTKGVVHSLAQFATLAASRAEGDVPLRGSLPTADARTLIDVLGECTSPGERCWFGLWFGYGEIRNVVQRLSPPRVQGPLGREYMLYSGSLGAALAIIDRGWEQTPNLWWSADHTWCVATEIDLDSTYIGGAEPLIRRLLLHPELEVVTASLGDRITFDSDEINRATK
jgi:hypothetical protein